MTLLAERPASKTQTENTNVFDFIAAEQFVGRKRFTREDCDFLERAGFLSGRYELLDGEVILKMGQNQPHAVTITLLLKWLIATFSGDFVLCQLPIEIANEDKTTNQPEPDAAVLSCPVTHFVESMPGPDDLRLVVEVSDTTLAQDIRIKSGLYARAGIAEYWILDVPGRRLLVQTMPDTEDGKYQSMAAYSENDSVAPLCALDNTVLISDLLPPRQTKDS